MTGPTSPEPHGSVSLGSSGSQGPRRPRRGSILRDLAPAIAGLLLLTALGIGAVLLGSDDGDEPKRKAAATQTQPATTETAPPPETAAETAPEEESEAEKPESRRREVRVPLRRVRGGMRGRGVVAVRRTGRRQVQLTVTARIRRAVLEVRLVRRPGRSKLLLEALEGPATVTKRVPRVSLRRYRTIVVVARRVGGRRSGQRVPSLAVRTARITRRLGRAG